MFVTPRASRGKRTHGLLESVIHRNQNSLSMFEKLSYQKQRGWNGKVFHERHKQKSVRKPYVPLGGDIKYQGNL